jgi:PAS domain S-box-containing protein
LRRAKIFSDNLVAAIVLRNAEAKIVYCSPYTEVLTGYSIQEIKSCAGDFFESVMHADDREQYRRALKICASGEAFQYRYRLTHRTGIEIWVETRTVPILNQDGRVESYLSVTLDVTGNVRYQKQVEEKNRDLQDFTYMVSHDLKAPIFTIKGMLGIIRDDFGKSLSPDFQEVLGHIERGILRLEQLVSRVLEYSRISTQDGKAEPVDLSHTLAEVAKDFSTQLAEAKGTLTIPPNLPSVSGDPLQIYRVFANLIGNAIKYRSPDRAVAISISYELTRDGRYVRISVVDNGQGIPADKIESVFRPFHRLHGASVEGTGIGLATVKKIAERSGGSIELKSAEDAGSTFIVSLKKHAHEESARNIASR